MYRTPKYYAARTAAIKEALAEVREKKPLEKSAKVPAPYSAECLRECGRTLSVTLGVMFGDRQGEVVDAVLCYHVTQHISVAMFRDGDETWIVEVCDYAKSIDIYNLAFSLVAVI